MTAVCYRGSFKPAVYACHLQQSNQMPSRRKSSDTGCKHAANTEHTGCGLCGKCLLQDPIYNTGHCGWMSVLCVYTVDFGSYWNVP